MNKLIKIFDSWSRFTPKEDIEEYLDPLKVQKFEWYEQIPEKEKLEVIKNSAPGDQVDLWTGAYLEFCNVDDNGFLYRKLNDSREFKALFEPLDFFNLIYQQLKIILINVHNSEWVIDHLLNLNLTKRKKHFFLYGLHYLINGANGPAPDPGSFPPVGDPETFNYPLLPGLSKNLAFIHLRIIDEYKLLEKELSIDTGSYYLKNARNSEPLKPLIYSHNAKKLNISQIALIHVYNRTWITRENAPGIAKRHGFYSKNSGERLYQKFSYYSSNANRRSVPETKKKLVNKVDLFEGILLQLEEKPRELAEDEIKILKIELEKGN